MKIEDITYEEMIEKFEKKNKTVSLLMGNGFSIAYDSNMFSYNKLAEFIKNIGSINAKKLFNIFGTSNFELIMEQLDKTLKISEEFGANENFIENIKSSTEELKNNLINAVSGLHPEQVFDMSESKSKNCKNFFKLFTKTKGELFTTNYDLLMYWVLMRNEDIKEFVSDGFGGNDFEGIIWGNNKDSQNIHFLHGALQIFDNGIEIEKETYNGKNYVLDNIKDRIKNNQYPVFVTSGNGDDKLKQIKHNSYLSFCYDRLCNVEDSLVTFGFNFGDYDDHIVKAINKAAKISTRNFLKSIYIGYYSEADKAHIKRIANKFKTRKVFLYCTKDVNVW